MFVILTVAVVAQVSIVVITNPIAHVHCVYIIARQLNLDGKFNDQKGQRMKCFFNKRVFICDCFSPSIPREAATGICSHRCLLNPVVVMRMTHCSIWKHMLLPRSRTAAGATERTAGEASVLSSQWARGEVSLPSRTEGTRGCLGL